MDYLPVIRPADTGGLRLYLYPVRQSDWLAVLRDYCRACHRPEQAPVNRKPRLSSLATARDVFRELQILAYMLPRTIVVLLATFLLALSRW